MTDTQSALDHLMATVLQTFEQNAYPLTPYDPDWPSPCYRHEAKPGVEVSWQPVRNAQDIDMFARLSEALETKLHPSVAEYFNRYWSDPILCRMPDGRCISLLFAWNSDDMERLRGNLVGHALSKRKQKRPITLFFATLEPNTDYMLSVDNSDGSIWLERPGKPPEQQLSPSLAEFLNSLEPVA